MLYTFKHLYKELMKFISDIKSSKQQRFKEEEEEEVEKKKFRAHQHVGQAFTSEGVLKLSQKSEKNQLGPQSTINTIASS